MSAKYSNGYLTPQANKGKRISKVKRTGSNENLNIKDLSDSFFQKLMSCPIKRNLVLTLINSEKDNIEEYKRNRAAEERRKEVNASPLLKIKKKYLCESPTALWRRRALEQKDHQIDSKEDMRSDCTSTSSSTQSTASSCPSPIPFDKLLDGIVAYVEVRSKDQDRSGGAKALMRAMGATIKETFTKDVTHVIFKDGSFTTYQKAKLMKVHLVSVLWIEAVRSNNMRVPEKKFPALGTENYNNNVSTLCSQMQKEYEGLIRDELHRSLTTGTPLPSTQALIDRRRTLMTPRMTPISSVHNKFSQELPSSQDVEVERIVNSRRTTHGCSESPVTDDDSDLALFINGTNMSRKKSSVTPNLLKHNAQSNLKNNLDNSSMELTLLEKSTLLNGNEKSRSNEFCNELKENCNPNNTIEESIYNKKTPKLNKSSNGERSIPMEDVVFNIPEDSRNKRRTRQLHSNNDSKLRYTKNVSYPTEDSAVETPHRSISLQILSKNVCNASNNADNATLSSVERYSSTNMSSLNISPNKEKSNSDKSNEAARTSTSTNMSSLQISSNKDKSDTDGVNEVVDGSTGTNMTSLQISLNNKVSETVEMSINDTMSALRISSNSSKDKSAEPENLQDSESDAESFKAKESFSPINVNVINKVLQVLKETPPKDDNVTKRRKKSSIGERRRITRGKRDFPSNEKKESHNVESNKGKLSTPSPAKKTKNNFSPSQNNLENECDGNKKTVTKKSMRLESESMKPTPQITNGKVTFAVKRTKSLQRTSKNYVNSDLSKQVEDSCIISNNSQDSPEDNIGNKQLNRTRKLYNSNELIQDIIRNDESERECKRNEVTKRKSEEVLEINYNVVTISPNTLLTVKAKEFVDQKKINLKDILNKETEKKPKIPKKTKSNVTHIKRNSDADEQHQLAAEFSKKQKTTQKSTTKKQQIIARRKSARLSQHCRKKLNLDSSTSSSDDKCIAPITPPLNRRSTIEFQTKSQMSSNKKLKIDKNKRPSIVCTKLHKEDIQIFNQIVRKLGGFVIEDEVSSKTTHLVAGEPKRTINMLRAVAMGCWILKHEWLLRSLEEGKWLPEEDFEETNFSPAVQQCRLQRQAFGPSYTTDIFQDCGPIYIARGSTPRCSDLKELVSLCKGHISNIPRNAAIVVGEYVKYEGVKCVKETWLLDSITFNKKMPLKKYMITPTNRSPVV